MMKYFVLALALLATPALADPGRDSGGTGGAESGDSDTYEDRDLAGEAGVFVDTSSPTRNPTPGRCISRGTRGAFTRTCGFQQSREACEAESERVKYEGSFGCEWINE